MAQERPSPENIFKQLDKKVSPSKTVEKQPLNQRILDHMRNTPHRALQLLARLTKRQEIPQTTIHAQSEQLIHTQNALPGGEVSALQQAPKQEVVVAKQNESIQDEPFIPSQYYRAALHEVRVVVPDKEQQVAGILKSIDTQGIENYQSNVHEGVAVPYTRVSVNKVVEESLPPTDNHSTETAYPPKEKQIYVIFGGYASPPAGHPFTAWDMVYDRAITSMGGVVGPERRGEPAPDIEVISLGSPNGLGGKVTEEWAERLKTEGISAYGKLYAELLKNLLPEDPAALTHTRVIFQSMSMGGPIAEQTAHNLPQLHENIRLLLDNPVGDQNGQLFSLLRGLQAIPGFLGEASIRMGLDRRIKRSIVDEKVFLKSLQERLNARGIDVGDSDKEKALKRKASLIDALNLVKGTTRDDEAIRTYIRRGINDPLTFSPLYLAKTLIQSLRGRNAVTGEGRTLQFGINATHFINRYRVNRWSSMIDYCAQKKEGLNETTH